MKSRKRKTAKRHSAIIRQPRRQKAHVVSIWPSGFIQAQLRGITRELLVKFNMKEVRAIFYNGEDCANYEPIDLTPAQKQQLIARERLFAKMAKKMGPENERRRMRDIRAQLGQDYSPFEFEALYGGER